MSFVVWHIKICTEKIQNVRKVKLYCIHIKAPKSVFYKKSEVSAENLSPFKMGSFLNKKHIYNTGKF